ncbi:MAG: hypothetical protein AAF483_15390 [Planctomycetota bacterium]
MKTRFVSILFLLTLTCILVGCGDSREPVDIPSAKSIKAGTKLIDTEAKLGSAGRPSSKQLEALQKTINRMPEKVRDNAEADKKLAWGNDQTFLAVVVNEEGVIWASAFRSGNAAGGPKGPPDSMRNR